MLKFLNNFFKDKTPRYYYRLDEIKYHSQHKNYIYIFKVYGCHSFAKLTFHDIKDSRKLRWLINPDDLIEIYINEEKHSKECKIYRIKETKRNNWYVLSNGSDSETISGDDVCNSPSLIEFINSFDIYKISYQTGFLHGRQFSKALKDSRPNKNQGKILNFQVIDKP